MMDEDTDRLIHFLSSRGVVQSNDSPGGSRGADVARAHDRSVSERVATPVTRLGWVGESTLCRGSDYADDHRSFQAHSFENEL
jgi:hypothetical protein